ncbi:hypothetical protein D3D03_10895 [Exiguobacterium sp. RIT452]|uniref:Uncharacterized protein n=1 Tax=Exiguobacterium undae TaxID=169177 RepID=A0ABX2V8C6_9BACL|nr:MULTISPECIES: hypothetical protein [Exiguobacterium]OAN14469.1 hypothetical protein A3783_00655 [Exiguobacterium undae]RJO98223.1 hypothetical protein D3D03_10895 [Exiguobacterium sp. RIT452]
MKQRVLTSQQAWTEEQLEMIQAIQALGELIQDRPRRTIYRRYAIEHGWPQPETIIRQFGSWPEALSAAGYEWHIDQQPEELERAPKYTKDEILKSFHRYAQDVGSTITLKKYQIWRKSVHHAPSHYHIVKMFGSWHDACTAAGLEASVTYSKAELAASLRQAIEEVGFSLSFEAYREWAKRNNKPSTKALLHRYGSWSAAIHAIESEIRISKQQAQ